MTSSDTVSIERDFDHSPERLWQAWTDASQVQQWFGSDPKGNGLQAELDVKPGGQYSVSFRDGDGTVHTCYGVYHEVRKPGILSFTWNWANERVESFVTVSLTSNVKGTHMVFTHARVGTASQHNYTQGWNSTFDKLDSLLRGDA